MNVFIIADLEGISGVCRGSQTNRDEFDYQSARKYLTWDINACVEGCVAGGAKKIVVRDEHGGGALNSIWQDLDPRAEHIQGVTGWERIPDAGTRSPRGASRKGSRFCRPGYD